MSKLRKSVLVGTILAVMLVLLLYPFESTVVPEWRARVVDEAGKPLTGVIVSEHWQPYSIETECHEAETHSDDNGYVVFPRIAIRASIFLRAVGPVRSILATGVHASFWISAYLIVSTGYEHITENDYYRPSQPPPQTVVIRRLQR
jgi:hypothetical protein